MNPTRNDDFRPRYRIWDRVRTWKLDDSYPRKVVPATRRTRKSGLPTRNPVFEVDLQVIPVTDRTHDKSYPKLLPN